MPSQLFSVVPDERYIVLQLQVSAMDVDACDEMEALLQEHIENECRPVIMDLSRAKFLPSMAIGALVRAKKTLAECGSTLTIVGLAPNIRRALEVAHIDRGLYLAQTLQEAVAQPPAP